MSSMDDLIRAQMKNGNRNNANFWINRPGYGGDSDQDQEQEQDEAKKEEERIKRRVLYGRYNNFDNQGRMTPEYEYFLKEKEKHEKEGLRFISDLKDLTEEERKEKIKNDPIRRAIDYQHDRHDRIVGWNHGNEDGQRFFFEEREKPDIDEFIRSQGKIGHGSYELTRKLHKNWFGKRDDKSGNSTKGMTDSQKEWHKWRMSFKDEFGYDPLADKETQERQKKAYEARKRSAEG